ncbi:hypothetical protein MTsPCn3_13080 [Erythrobacter sp. MTPC3]
MPKQKKLASSFRYLNSYHKFILFAVMLKGHLRADKLDIGSYGPNISH